MKGAKLPGKTYVRGEAGFDEAVLSTSFSAEDPGCRPCALVQANTIDDVSQAVRWAGREGWRIACCSGGHSWSQNHIRDGGMLIDLSRLDSVEVATADRRAIIGPGCRAGDLDAALFAHGLFFPVPHAYTVGLGGFLLQGGFGWNSQVLGLGCENVVGIDVILGDGRLVHASENENRELLWASRGSGPGFFGIIVRFHLRLHARPKFIGMKMQVFRMRHMDAVVRWAHEIGPQVSPQVEMQMAFNHKAFGIFSPGIEVITPVMADNRREAKELLEFIDRGPLHSRASLTLPLLSLPLRTIMKTAEKMIFLPDTRWHVDNVWLAGPIEPVLPTLWSILDRQPARPSHVIWLNWRPAAAQRADMAFSLEAPIYLAFYGGLRGKDSPPDGRCWATESARAMEASSPGSQLADENLARRPAQFMAADNVKRLEALRAKYDPDRRFFSFGRD